MIDHRKFRILKSNFFHLRLPHLCLSLGMPWGGSPFFSSPLLLLLLHDATVKVRRSYQKFPSMMNREIMAWWYIILPWRSISLFSVNKCLVRCCVWGVGRANTVGKPQNWSVISWSQFRRKEMLMNFIPAKIRNSKLGSEITCTVSLWARTTVIFKHMKHIKLNLNGQALTHFDEHSLSNYPRCMSILEDINTLFLHRAQVILALFSQ